MIKQNEQHLKRLAALARYWILTSTTHAGSGHPTSSLSAVELGVALFFGGVLHADLSDPEYHNNDRVIFSKGHAVPLMYTLYAIAGKILPEELSTLRTFNSRLEGHPTERFPYTEAATGSLGQGLSIGVGMAINAKYLDKLSYKTYVLLGDSEMAEGSVWEAIQLAAHYKLDNLIGVIDVNRLGQRGETMLGHDVSTYRRRLEAFGWNAVVVDGHNISQVLSAYRAAQHGHGKPVMIIAKTVKGKGVSFLENKNGWHGKVLSESELPKALAGLDFVDTNLRGKVLGPKRMRPRTAHLKVKRSAELTDAPRSTRQAYGQTLVKLFARFPEMVVLDAEVSNSTYAETFKHAYPERFFEMFIAEQNMVGVAIGLALRGKIPFISTFAAFFTRAFDQIRMAQHAGLGARINFVGSHAGTSIGQDGPSQMGLEDIAMFRAVLGSCVLYPADSVADEKLVTEAIRYPGVAYIRTTRMDTGPLYKRSEKFLIGGSKTLRTSKKDVVTVITAGVTLYEALTAHDELKKQGIAIRVVDAYSIKPIDAAVIKKAARETKAIITVEDHYAEGGLGEAVRSAIENSPVPIFSLAVRKMPRSGKPAKLLEYEQISHSAIVKLVKTLS